MDLAELLDEMKKKNEKIIAHPYSYVSAIHNNASACPVNQNDKFFTDNNISFSAVVPECIGVEDAPEMDSNYVVGLDEAGAYYRRLVKKENLAN